MSGKAALAGALALLFSAPALAQDPNFEAQRTIPDTPGSLRIHACWRADLHVSETGAGRPT